MTLTGHNCVYTWQPEYAIPKYCGVKIMFFLIFTYFNLFKGCIYHFANLIAFYVTVRFELAPIGFKNQIVCFYIDGACTILGFCVPNGHRTHVYAYVYSICFVILNTLYCKKESTRLWANNASMLVHCLRRWPNIRPILAQRVMLVTTLSVF